MDFLRKKIEEIKPLFTEGGKFEKFYFIFEAHETLFFQPSHVTKAKGAHIRDAVDMKRMMITVIVALVPCLLFGMWNIGELHYKSIAEASTLIDNVLYGALKLVPIIAVCYIFGLGAEFIFATIRRHPINEGFLVTGMLLPLVVPYTIPLWQVAVATVFAVVLGKEVFGGTGMNILNPALTARAFLFFAYPGQISGDSVWVDGDGISGATVLSDAANGVYVGNAVTEAGEKILPTYDFADMFFGFIPGSIGETSTLMCIIGAVILIASGIGSWRTMAAMVIGGAAMAYIAEAAGADYFGGSNFYYHLVAGGFAFGTVFMATDPVSAAQTNTGKWIYGAFAGVMAILVRIVNPAYPEGVMLAILLANVFAPLFDYFVVSAHKKRRLSRATR